MPRIILFVLAVLLSTTLGFAASSNPNPTTSTLAVAPMPGKWQWIWINRVEDFRAENATLDPEQQYVVFLGDSLTQGFNLEKYFPGAPVLNRGISSDGIMDFPGGTNIWRGVVRRMKECIDDCNPSHVFLLIGTNDVGPTHIPIEYWQGGYIYVTETIRAKFPDVKIVAVTLPPTGYAYSRHERLNKRILLWNDFIRSYAEEQDFPLIDLYELLADEEGMLPEELTRDGLHFNHLGYDRYAEKIREILVEDGVLEPST